MTSSETMLTPFLDDLETRINEEEERALHGINLSQPHCNDLNAIFENTIAKDLRIIGFPYDAAQREQKAGRRFNGKLHCRKP